MTTSNSYSINSLKKIRALVQNAVKDLTIEQLNKVPAGFNNNIIWNVAHIIAAQEGVCYLRAGLPANVSETFYQTYKPGTKPETNVDATVIAQINTLLTSSIDQLETDLQLDKFGDYKPWTTRYGVEINNIDEAVAFLPFHEGMHAGYILALKRLV